MAEATITFKNEDREGIIPVGSYLSDAAKRFGIRFEDKCDPPADVHYCAVSIAEGEAFLSPPTSAESRHISEDPDVTGERLACQAKITGPGEIVIMTKKKEKESKEPEAETGEKYAKEFAELPLEKKIAELVHLEAITLGETFSFILNSPYLIFDKVMGVMAEFGLKKEEEGKKASRPEEHVNGATRAEKKESAKGAGSKENASTAPASE